MSPLRTVALALLLLATARETAHAGGVPWVRLPSPTTANLRALFFADSLTGWVGGEGGAMFRTTDGGMSWTPLTSGTTGTIEDITFFNGLKGWAVAHEVQGPSVYSVLLTTGDGGDSWSAENYPEADVILNSLVYHTPDTGWAAGEFGTLLGTVDGGRTWTTARRDSSTLLRWDLRRVRFHRRSLGLAVGGRFDFTGVVWRTTTGGEVWSNDVAGAEPVNDVHFIDSLNILGIGGDTDFGSGMVRSTDAGATWEYTYLGIWGEARALGFRTPAEGWAPLGFSADIMMTADTGRTWTSMPVPDTSAIYELLFTDSTHGYMVGNRGRIFRYDATVNDVRGERTFPSSVRLLPAYPNPFNPSSTIILHLERSALVRLELADLLGRRVAVLADAVLSAGEHRIPVSGEGLAGGVYLCRAVVGGVVAAAQKLVLVK